MSRTFLALLQFDGTRFVGWQRQSSGRSVQGEFERVLARLCGGHVAAHASGRTDAGVHALAMGVSFAVPTKWTAPALHRALNALLPDDCWVERVDAMQPGFHARKSALRRRYRYDIGTDAASRSPFRRRWEWALGRPLDLSLLERSAAAILGEHEFRAFAVKGPERPHYRCRIEHAAWQPRPHQRGVRFEVAADRFLHHMVRMLVGTMADIAQHRRPLEDIGRLLGRRDNHDTSPPAPAEGLFFVAAHYPPECYAPADAASEDADAIAVSH